MIIENEYTVKLSEIGKGNKVTNKAISKSISTQKRIMYLMVANPNITIYELMNNLSMSYSGIKKNLIN